VNVVVVASPLLAYKLASYTWLLWMGCLVPILTAYALAKVPLPRSLWRCFLRTMRAQGLQGGRGMAGPLSTSQGRWGSCGGELGGNSILFCTNVGESGRRHGKDGPGNFSVGTCVCQCEGLVAGIRVCC